MPESEIYSSDRNISVYEVIHTFDTVFGRLNHCFFTPTLWLQMDRLIL